MINYKFTYLITALLLLISCHKRVEVEEICYPLRLGDGNRINASFNSILFISPDIAFSAIHLRKEKGVYPYADEVCKSIDGGKTWMSMSIIESDIVFLRYNNGTLYAIENLLSIKRDTEIRVDENGNSKMFGVNVPAESYIIYSNDDGKNWSRLSTFDDTVINFHIFDSLNMIVVKREIIRPKEIKYWIYHSKDGGKTWVKPNGLPNVKNTDYVSKDGNKIFFESGSVYNMICFYDVSTGEVGKIPMNYFVYAFYVSDGIMSIAKKGWKIWYYSIDNENLSVISKIKWGAFRGGAIMSEPLAKDNNYVFSFISQYPGRDNINGVLFFSETGGKQWRKVREFKRYESIYNPLNCYSNDTIFQVAYNTLDSLRIFRIKKHNNK